MRVLGVNHITKSNIRNNIHCFQRLKCELCLFSISLAQCDEENTHLAQWRLLNQLNSRGSLYWFGPLINEIHIGGRADSLNK